MEQKWKFDEIFIFMMQHTCNQRRFHVALQNGKLRNFIISLVVFYEMVCHKIDLLDIT